MRVCPKEHLEQDLWFVERISYYYCRKCHKHYSKDEVKEIGIDMQSM